MNAIAYPNDRSNPNAAIPVYIVAGPIGKAIPVNFLVGAPVGPDFGPFPVRVALAGGGGGTDQGVDANAIPVYLSTSANAMPVWDIAPAAPVLPPEVDEVTFTLELPVQSGVDVVGSCTATNGPVTWYLASDETGLCRMTTGSGQIVIVDPTASAVPGTYALLVEATNPGGIGQGTMTLELTEP
jgi:hypothetical protein